MTYERVDETGMAQSIAQTKALEAAEQQVLGWVESTMLADGRLRIYLLSGTGLIMEIRYIASDGAEEVER